MAIVIWGEIPDLFQTPKLFLYFYFFYDHKQLQCQWTIQASTVDGIKKRTKQKFFSFLLLSIYFSGELREPNVENVTVIKYSAFTKDGLPESNYIPYNMPASVGGSVESLFNVNTTT